jgi:hypothetical protein
MKYFPSTRERVTGELVALSAVAALGLTACNSVDTDSPVYDKNPHSPSNTTQPPATERLIITANPSVTNEKNSWNCTVKPTKAATAGKHPVAWTVRLNMSQNLNAQVIGTAVVFGKSDIKFLNGTSATPQGMVEVLHPVSFADKHTVPFQPPLNPDETLGDNATYFAFTNLSEPSALELRVLSDHKPRCTVGQSLVRQTVLDRLTKH